MELQQLFNEVRHWAIAKEITGPEGKGTREKQMQKVLEEVEETRLAVSRFELASSIGARECLDCLDEIEDGIGDSIVTLIILAEMHGLSAERCLETAYKVISKRTGQMIDGVFVKDQYYGN